MSTLIDSTKSAGFSQSIPALSAGYYSAGNASVIQTQGLTGHASVSLNADLGAVSDATSAGQFTVAFAQALQTATSVDPATGHREMITGANEQLASTLKSLLVSSGFTSKQAIVATQGFVKKLAQGGDISMSATYGSAAGTGGPTSQAYSDLSTAANAIATTERSGSVSIGINLDTGKLDVSLASESTQAYSPPEKISGSSAAALDVSTIAATPPLVVSEATPYAVQQQASQTALVVANSVAPGRAVVAAAASGEQSANADSASNSGTTIADNTDNAGDLTPLISTLSNTTLHGQQNIVNLLMRMSGGAPSAAPSVRVGFSQTLAIRRLDANGYGSTLYKRPDGSTAQMSLAPTHIVV